MTPKPIIHSYTLLDTFHNVCPRKADELYISRTTKKEPYAPGVDIHKLVEDAIRAHAPLPPEVQSIAPIVESLRAAGLKLAVEIKMGATRDWMPAVFFESQTSHRPGSAYPWIRGVPDLLAYRGDNQGSAVMVDWKSGKPTDNWLQHAINAQLVFVHYPRIEKLVAFNAYTKTGEIGDKHVFLRDQRRAQQAEIEMLAAQLEAARDAGDFPARAGPLCGWCPVKVCPHNRSEKT